MEARNKLARKSVRPNKATFLSYKSFYFKKINQRDETATYTPPTMENISIYFYMQLDQNFDSKLNITYDFVTQDLQKRSSALEFNPTKISNAACDIVLLLLHV